VKEVARAAPVFESTDAELAAGCVEHRFHLQDGASAIGRVGAGEEDRAEVEGLLWLALGILQVPPVDRRHLECAGAGPRPVHRGDLQK